MNKAQRTHVLIIIIIFACLTYGYYSDSENAINIENSGTPNDAVSFTGFIERKQTAIEGNSDDITYTYISENQIIEFSKSKVSVLSHPDHDHSLSFTLDFHGANDITPTGRGLMEYKTTIIQSDETNSDLRSHKEVWYQNIYDNIDLRYYLTEHGLKYDFIVNPGGHPSAIEIEILGVDLQVFPDMVKMGSQSNYGNIIDTGLVVYQGDNTAIEACYKISDQANAYGFTVGDYDLTQPLIIDPLFVVHSTYYGGQYQRSYVVDTDTQGFTYLINGGMTIKIIKFNATGIDYVTYVDGDGFDWANNAVVDDIGNIYMTGTTSSSDLPVVNSVLGYSGSNYDVWAGMYRADNTGFVWCTYLGSTATANNNGYSIVYDDKGDAYIAGQVAEEGFPLVNAYSDVHTYGFLTKIALNGDVVYSTYLGTGTETQIHGYSVVVNTDYNAIVVGSALSDVDAINPLQPEFGGGLRDAYIAKYSADGSEILLSSYFGSDVEDEARASLLDKDGNLLIVGETSSDNLTITTNAYQSSLSGTKDLFVVKINISSSELMYSTFLGGTEYEELRNIGNNFGGGIDVDDDGNLFISGRTGSNDLPTTINGYDTSFNGGSGDGFVLALNSTLTGLIYSSYVGGSLDDAATHVSVEGSFDETDFDLRMVVSTASDNLPPVGYQLSTIISTYYLHISGTDSLIDFDQSTGETSSSETSTADSTSLSSSQTTTVNSATTTSDSSSQSEPSRTDDSETSVGITLDTPSLVIVFVTILVPGTLIRKKLSMN